MGRYRRASIRLYFRAAKFPAFISNRCTTSFRHRDPEIDTSYSIASFRHLDAIKQQQQKASCERAGHRPMAGLTLSAEEPALWETAGREGRPASVVPARDDGQAVGTGTGGVRSKSVS